MVPKTEPNHRQRNRDKVCQRHCISKYNGTVEPRFTAALVIRSPGQNQGIHVAVKYGHLIPLYSGQFGPVQRDTLIMRLHSSSLVYNGNYSC